MGKNKELLEKIENNIWDDSEEVLTAIRDLLTTRQWHWLENPRCKYVEVRIDMRDGMCILKDRDGKRILVKDLEYQRGK